MWDPEDEHGECRAEIRRLQAELAAERERAETLQQAFELANINAHGADAICKRAIAERDAAIERADTWEAASVKLADEVNALTARAEAAIERAEKWKRIAQEDQKLHIEAENDGVKASRERDAAEAEVERLRGVLQALADHNPSFRDDCLRAAKALEVSDV
jgi:chromosome segregation ATPase